MPTSHASTSQPSTAEALLEPYGEAYQRKRKGPLKGGTGNGSGPLFG